MRGEVAYLHLTRRAEDGTIVDNGHNTYYRDNDGNITMSTTRPSPYGGNDLGLTRSVSGEELKGIGLKWQRVTPTKQDMVLVYHIGAY